MKTKILTEYGVGDKIVATPYRSELQIEVIGYIMKIGRGAFSRKRFIVVKGVKKNTYMDFLSFRIKIYEDDFDLIRRVS